MPGARLSCLAVLLLVPALAAAAAAPPQADVREVFDIGRDVGPIIVPVTIRGKAYPFVVDTGANGSVFDESLRPLLGKATANQAVLTAAGTMQGSFAMPPAAFVGRLPLPRNQAVQVLDLTRLRRAAGLHVCGVLGMDFLARYVVCIDFERGRLTLSRWPGRDAGQALPLKPGNGVPWVEVQVAGSGPTAWVVADTGSLGFTSGALNDALFEVLLQLERLKVIGNRPAETARGQHKVDHARLRHLAIGPFEHRDLLFTRSPSVPTLDLNFWGRYVTTFDFPGCVVYLRKSKGHAEPDWMEGSGLSLAQRAGWAVVQAVHPHSPAARAGLCAGDLVLSIDGRSGQTNLVVLRQLLCGAGRTAHLVIRHEGRRREVAIPLDGEISTAKSMPETRQAAR
jgi:hypothetical protein